MRKTPPTPDHEMAAMGRSIVTSLRRIIRAVALHSRWLMEQHGLTVPQLAALHEIERRRDISARELARTLEVSQPTLTGILDRLESQGFLTRKRNGTDRRAIDIALTPEGERVLKSAPPLLQERFTVELGKLQPWEQTMILATLQRIAAMMDATDLVAAPHLLTAPERL